MTNSWHTCSFCDGTRGSEELREGNERREEGNRIRSRMLVV